MIVSFDTTDQPGYPPGVRTLHSFSPELLMSSSVHRILFALTSHAQLGNTGRSTGFYLPELAHPIERFRQTFGADGAAFTFVSPQGGAAPQDGRKPDDPAQQRLFADETLRAQLQHTLTPEQIDPSHYDAIFFVGGHGTMWDFPDNRTLAAIAARIHDQGGVVAAVCHGPAALVNVQSADGRYLVADRSVSAFTDDEEQAVGLASVVPFLLESTLRERGARIVRAPRWAPMVSVDDRLVTGQNPASAIGVADAVSALLATGSAATV
jgi:putative intracellular protease/amidase